MSCNFNVIYTGGPDGLLATKKALLGIADVFDAKGDPKLLNSALPNADALLDASMKVHITDEMVETAKNLKVISCATTGADHIERTVLEMRKIPIFTLKNERALLNNITPAAELSWALLLASARKLVAAVEHVRAGQWIREEFPGVMLNGKQIGIVGCGRLGQWMSRYANAFGMSVVGYDPYLEEFPENIRRVSLQEMFETSDFISVHVHLSPETTGLVSRELLINAKPGMILINTSRGLIVDQDGLLEALESGRLGGAGLDVLTGEPNIANNALVEYSKSNDNLLITPHCGGYSPDAVTTVCEHAANKIKKVLLESP